MAHYLRLGYSAPPNSGQSGSMIWRLPVTSNPDEVRAELAAAEPDRFVPVQVVMSDQLHEQTLYVQLRAWASWMIHDLDEADTQSS